MPEEPPYEQGDVHFRGVLIFAVALAAGVVLTLFLVGGMMALLAQHSPSSMRASPTGTPTRRAAAACSPGATVGGSAPLQGGAEPDSLELHLDRSQSRCRGDPYRACDGTRGRAGTGPVRRRTHSSGNATAKGPGEGSMKAALLALLLAAQASATLPPEDFEKRVGFDQHLDKSLPLEETFTDTTGRPVRLGNIFGGKPVILVLAYFRCPNLCGIVLNGLLHSVRELKASAGTDYDVIAVSIDPSEPTSRAADKKASVRPPIRPARDIRGLAFSDRRAGCHRTAHRCGRLPLLLRRSLRPIRASKRHCRCDPARAHLAVFTRHRISTPGP